MLPRRLTAAAKRGVATVTVLITIAACSGGGGTLRENVVEPGITVIDGATALACDTDADTLRTVLEQFELLEGTPAESEAALVAAGYLRDESDPFDVVDGELRAQANACKGSVPVTTPDGSAPPSVLVTDLGQIVTDDQFITADDIFGTMTADDIADFGGEARREARRHFAAGERFVAREGRAPESLADLAGDLEAGVTLWMLDDTGEVLVPAAGSPCPDVFAETATAG